MHLGKAATFQAAGVPVPLIEAEGSLARLDTLLARLSVWRLIVLGDLWHAPAGMTERTLSAFCDWHAAHAELTIELVLGNHDRKLSESLHRRTGLQPLACLPEAPFYFCHEPEENAEGLYALGGHLHPGVRLVGPGRQSLAAPCFWFRETSGVLPAFGSFTGLGLIRPQRGDRIYLPIRPPL